MILGFSNGRPLKDSKPPHLPPSNYPHPETPNLCAQGQVAALGMLIFQSKDLINEYRPKFLSSLFGGCHPTQLSRNRTATGSPTSAGSSTIGGCFHETFVSTFT